MALVLIATPSHDVDRDKAEVEMRVAEFPMLLVADATQCRICVFMHARSIGRAIPNGQSESSGSSPDIPSQVTYSDYSVLSQLSPTFPPSCCRHQPNEQRSLWAL